MGRETESIVISNGDASNPIDVTVVTSVDDPSINWIVWLNPDGTLIWS